MRKVKFTVIVDHPVSFGKYVIEAETITEAKEKAIEAIEIAFGVIKELGFDNDPLIYTNGELEGEGIE